MQATYHSETITPEGPIRTRLRVAAEEIRSPWNSQAALERQIDEVGRILGLLTIEVIDNKVCTRQSNATQEEKK